MCRSMYDAPCSDQTGGGSALRRTGLASPCSSWARANATSALRRAIRDDGRMACDEKGLC